jgi:hypothetical protein
MVELFVKNVTAKQTPMEEKYKPSIINPHLVGGTQGIARDLVSCLQVNYIIYDSTNNNIHSN